MQEINAWLNNSGDFKTGMLLYIKYGSNSFFKKTLEKFGETPFNIQKLGAELSALAPTLPANQEYQELDADSSKQPPFPPLCPKETERYLSLKVLQQTKYRQLDHNRAALAISTDKSYRHLTAKQIIKLTDQIRDIYILLDFYEINQKFPDVAAKDNLICTPEEEIQLLRQSNSKAKSRIKKGNCRNLHKTEQLIIKNNKRISELIGKADV